MTSSILKRNLSDRRLHEIYGLSEYYWYHRSSPYVETFLKPLAGIINDFNLSCLDVGCGEGQLSPYVHVPYLGFDASVDAIQRATDDYASNNRSFQVDRIETFSNQGSWGTLVFGNVLHCLIRPEYQLSLVEKYLNQSTKYIIIYELERFKEKEITERFRLIQEIHASVEMSGIDEVKKHRKILVYSCD